MISKAGRIVQILALETLWRLGLGWFADEKLMLVVASGRSDATVGAVEVEQSMRFGMKLAEL